MALRDKSREESFKIWRKRLKLAKEMHREKVILWTDKIFKEYAGDFQSNLDTGERYSQIAQVIHSIEENIQPHLYMESPEFYANAKDRKSEWEGREADVAALVNHEYQDIKASGRTIDLENELVVLDARLIGYGCTKTTYQVEGAIIREQPENNVLDKVMDIMNGSLPDVIETPAISKEIGQVTERINPLDVYLDYSAEHITKQRFTIHKMDVSLDDLNADRYDQRIVKKMEPSVALVPDSMDRDEKQSMLKDPEFRGYRIYEIHDLENRTISTLADGIDDFIEFNRDYDIEEGSQFSFLWFLEAPNEVYPMSPVKFYRKRAIEQSYIYSQISTQIDKFMPKIFIDTSKLSSADKERFKTGSLGAMIGVNGPVAGVADVFNPTIQSDLFKYMAMIKELMNLESGVSDYDTANPESRKATEAALIQRGVKARRFKPQKRVKDFLINQSHTIFMTVLRNAPIEHFVKVLGYEDAIAWWEDPETGKEQWTADNQRGDYWFTYNVESIAPEDANLRKQRNIESLNVIKDPAFRELLAMEKKKLKIGPIFEKFVRENLGMRDIEQIIEDVTVPSPEEEHDAWMNGEFPHITEAESESDEDIVEHFQKHQAWIGSPGFQFLPDSIKTGAMEHLRQYEPLIAKLMQKQQAKQSFSQSQPIPTQDQATATETDEKFIREAI